MRTIIYITGSILILMSVVTVFLLKHEIALALLIGFLSIPFLLYLLQKYRDLRGGIRNDNGLCYKCGEVMNSRKSVYHYMGVDSSYYYDYCDTCAAAERDKRFIALSIIAIDFVLLVSAIVLSESRSEFLVAAQLIALLTAVFLVIYTITVRALALSHPSNIEAAPTSESGGHVFEQNAKNSEIDDLIKETKRLLSGELDPETRRLLQHAIDEHESARRERNKRGRRD